ncbi:ATP-binding protein [Magnetovibrio sp.]|uniref:ATP-binding protein n=1 Tax=Magnetovibrio sp. TaxID=2024836 RepID=UPI002F93AD27
MSKTSWLGGRYGVLFLSLVVTVAFVAIWSYQLWQGQERALVAAEATASNLARAMENANSRTVQAVDLILVNVAAGMRPGGWAHGRDGERNAMSFLQSLLDEAPQVREIAFADATGQITALSRRAAHPAMNIAHEPYFQLAQAGKLPPLYISTPYRGRLLGEAPDGGRTTKQWHLIFAQAVHDDDGTFIGVALAVINPGYFQEQIGSLDVGQKGFVAYYRYDGKLLVQGGPESLEIGKDNHADHPLFSDHLPVREWGTFRHEADPFHPAPHIVSYRATTRWPLLVAVYLDQNEVLASWRNEAWNFSVVMTGGLATLLMLSFVIYRQRATAEHAEKQLTLLSTALKTSANMVLITDIDANIVWVNDAFCHQFGYRFDEVVGQTPRLLKSGLVSPRVVTEMWESILGGRTWNGEFVNKRKDGSLVIVNQTISPILDQDGHVTHFVGIHDDITKRKETELELREAKINAESANSVKTQFLANMSHELRTPLNAVIGFTDMMRMEMFGPLGHEKYREYSADIHTSATHLLTLISDILDVSKVEAGKMDLSDGRIHLQELAESCHKLLNHRAKQNGITLLTDVADGLPDLLADQVRVKQIVLNLLTNAIKFTPKGGRIVLSMELGPDSGIIIRTEDTGIGIAPEDLGKVLEPFGQASEGNTLAREGVGLGLYLVKAFMEMHGGRIDITSELGVGTVVSVIFPPVRSLLPVELDKSQ